LNSWKITSSMRLPVVHQGGGEDRQAPAALAVAGRPEELPRELERAVVDAAAHGAAARPHLAVAGAAEARQAVEQDDDVLPRLDEALGALHGEARQTDVGIRGGVGRGGQHLGPHGRAGSL
jgi:hypothetical protein